jgi:hypothetical protein
MNSREAALLRTRLRQVNVEYSALVREKSAAGRFVRMGDLRAERRALMDLLAEHRPNRRPPPGFRPDPARQAAE